MLDLRIGIDMKYKVLILTVAVFAIFSCSVKQVDSPNSEGSEITIRASQEGASETRTTLIDGGTQVYWEPSDEIKLFFRGSGSRFISQNSENARVAEFSGTLNVAVGLNEGASGSNTLWGLYPYRADATSDGESVTTTLPAEQTGRAGTFAKNTHITLAKSNSFDLAFYNVCGGVRFSLTQEGIKRVTFAGNNGEALAGKIRLAFEDGIPAVQEISDTNKVISLSAPDGGTFQTGQWYYIEALPGALSGGYKMAFYKESEFAQLSSSSSVTLRRGVFGSLADADEDLMFKPTGGGDEPNPDDFIQFEDPIAKYACVEKFDINRDGEISYAEAAAVTSLSGLFADWNTVTSFDEIRYFTGVTSTNGVFNGLTKLKKANLPNHIQTVGTFRDCSSLESVTLPESLERLPSHCFDGCSSLSTISLPPTLKSLPSYCFNYCSSLSSITIPSDITIIPDYCFCYCSSLSTFELPSSITSIGESAFVACTLLPSIKFPEGLRSIGADAFHSCSAISSLDLPTSLSSLGERAFAWCTSLASVRLPSNMTTVPSGCFLCCEELTSIFWPQALTNIEDSAFSGCGFKNCNYTLELPSTVTSIGISSFEGTHHLILPSASFISIVPRSFKKGEVFLYVPANMVEMYKARSIWSDLAEWIRAIDEYPATLVVGGTIAEAVDLGLSVKWASWNVGASAPEEYGDYFSWGETGIKWDYSWATYKWCNGSEASLTKYNSYQPCGIVDDKELLDPEDDAAHVNWGGTWRIPTFGEYNELWLYCKVEWVTVNGVNGRRFTSTKSGYTDKSVFLPAAGYRDYGIINSAGYQGMYWTREVNVLSNEFFKAYCGGFNSNYGTQNFEYRYYGNSIRPVCEK